MRIHHENSAFCGPHTICGEENLWEIHEFGHSIYGNSLKNIWGITSWEARHRPIWVVLEVGAFLPVLYGVDVGNHEYLKKIEIFWMEHSEESNKSQFYFKHKIYPVKISSIQMIMPHVKEEKNQKLKHLVRIEFRYRWIEHLYFNGHYFTKAEWNCFFTNECDEVIPEKYITGRCLSDEAVEWEKNWRKDQAATIKNPRWEHADEDKKENSPDTASFGDTIILMADVTGIPDGADATFDIFDMSEEPAQRVDCAKGKIRTCIAKGEWVVKDSGKGDDMMIAFEAIAKGKKSDKKPIDTKLEIVHIFSV